MPRCERPRLGVSEYTEEYNRRALMGILAGRTREATLVCLLFVLLTLVLAAPLSLSPATHALPLSADTRLFLWTISWDVEALLHHPLTLFDANIFYPEPRTLAYSEHILGSAVIGAPALLATGNPVLALNVIVLLSCVLCGLGAYVLARELGASVPGALVAGIDLRLRTAALRASRTGSPRHRPVDPVRPRVPPPLREGRPSRRPPRGRRVLHAPGAHQRPRGPLHGPGLRGARLLPLGPRAAAGPGPDARRSRRRGSAPPRRQRGLLHPLPAGAARRGAAPHDRRRLRLESQRRELPRRPHPRPAVAAVARPRPAREGGGSERLSLPGWITLALAAVAVFARGKGEDEPAPGSTAGERETTAAAPSPWWLKADDAVLVLVALVALTIRVSDGIDWKIGSLSLTARTSGRAFALLGDPDRGAAPPRAPAALRLRPGAAPAPGTRSAGRSGAAWATTPASTSCSRFSPSGPASAPATCSTRRSTGSFPASTSSACPRGSSSSRCWPSPCWPRRASTG